ncbi:B3 domain-containing protein At4g01580 [Medicago truncatula]|uniref:B3 domain-containing protein At4g01580 n=1 Tax=Medicago truncatula TaxID=3880 RepID=UPI000D2F17DF|nr:B3 domain-containing protein At4g01580 [Medicago truncatula]
MSSQELEHQNNGVHFFKIILASILQEGKLRVPINFARRHWHGITNPVTLRLPTMAQMNVTWEKTSDYDVWFCNGWKEFANYLSLRDSQLLVFRYRKKSLFDVIVFGKCGLEIKYPLRETCDGSLKVTEDPSSSPGKRRKSPSPCVKVIPTEFVKTHMHMMEEGNAILFVDQDRTWNVDLDLTLNKQFALTSGWSEFCAHNNLKFGDGWLEFLKDCYLKEGDTCLLKMSGGTGLELEKPRTSGGATYK